MTNVTAYRHAAAMRVLHNASFAHPEQEPAFATFVGQMLSNGHSAEQMEKALRAATQEEGKYAFMLDAPGTIALRFKNLILNSLSPEIMGRLETYKLAPSRTRELTQYSMEQKHQDQETVQHVQGAIKAGIKAAITAKHQR